MLDKLPTLDNFAKMRIRVTNSRCVLCLNEEENISHPLFTCQSVRKIWYLCDMWVGVQPVLTIVRLRTIFLALRY